MTTSHPTPREELARAAMSGDRAGFDALGEAVRPRLLHALRRRLPNREDAEDVAQLALLRAWEKRGTFDAGRSFWPWLLTIAMRLATDHARREARRPTHRLDVEPDAGPGGDAALARVLDAERRDDLWSVADAVLAPRQRAALWLVYGESMTTAEAATALRLTTVHLRVTLHRARQKLKPHLGRFVNADDHEPDRQGPEPAERWSNAAPLVDASR